MKKTITLFFVIFNILIFAQSPTAKFSISQGTNTSGNHQIIFTDESLGSPTTYLWEFSSGGDIATSSLQNPSVTYNKLGDYTVKLTVSNSNGSSTLSTKFTIGNKLDLSTGKNDDGSLMPITAVEDTDWSYIKEGSGLPSVHPNTRETYTGWSFAQIVNSQKNSVWISGNGTETGYYNYTSKNFIVNSGEEAYLSLRSLSFVRNWTYLVKDNGDGTFSETEITKTDFLSDGAKGWLNSRSPLVDKTSLNPGTYNIKVRVYSNNAALRESIDVNSALWFGNGFSVTPLSKISANTTSASLGTPIQFYSNVSGKVNDIPVSYSWEFTDGNNTITSTEANPNITFQNSGFHNVKLTTFYNDDSSSTASIDKMIEITSSVLGTQENLKDKYQIYPNPAENFIYVNGDNILYGIYDANGKLLSNGKSTGNRIDISKYPKGIYFVKINGKLEKLIKK